MSGENGMDRIRIGVQSIDGVCGAGHFKGEEILIENLKISSYLCPEALYAMWPMIQVLKFRGELPWGDKHGITVCCPDASNLVRFEIRSVGPLLDESLTRQRDTEDSVSTK